jgi:thioredoxin reductase
VLPDVPGLRELWGDGVFHCPYCHGYELHGQPLAVYGRGEAGVEQALLVGGWTPDLVLLTDGPADLTDDQRGRLAAAGIAVREERVARLAGTRGGLEAVVFADGTALARRGVYTRPPQRLRDAVAQRLGCALTEAGHVQADAWGATSVPGVFAAGDLTGRLQQLVGAAAEGLAAAAGMNTHWLRVAGHAR